jgi:pyruvate dehydrogenase E2 component (dihydrolipoamide acetyltransferase)
MSIEVRLPQLGESITHARLSQWLKKEGDRVSRGDVIAEVETDKTSVEIESPGEGVLSKILVPANTDKVPVDALLAVLDAGAQAAVPEPQARRESHVVHMSDARPAERPAAVAAAAAATAPALAFVPAPAPPPASSREADIAASPLARRMAYAAGVSLASIRGTGRGGRITKEDVEATIGPRMAPAGAPIRPTPAPAIALPADDPARFEVQTLSTMRRVSAERLTQSKQQIPHFYLRAECAMDAVARAREEINARSAEKLSFTAFTLRAAALALKKVPAANAMWADGAVRLYNTVDLAVAVNTPSGLIAPVVRSVETKTVAAINREIRDLAERARAGKLKPEDYTGGTCTVSNLGMFGITSLYPIINPPQTCILGVGAIEERAVVRDHALAVGLMMTCTLAADHRALDGATGAEFLAAFRHFAEDPWLLLL